MDGDAGVGPLREADGTTGRLLRRSTQDRVIAGVCGGIARYFGVDPILVRVGAVIFGFLGPGLIAYLVAWLVIPSDDGQAVIPGVARSGQAGAYLAGVVLVAAGTAWAIDMAVPGLAKVLWPAVLVAAGVALLTGVRR